MTVAPPPVNDPEALIPEARDRQRRRRMLAAAGVAIAAALGLGSYALVGGFAGARAGAKPVGSSGVPLCRASQLSSVPFGFGLYPGFVGEAGGLDFTNIGTLSCTLPRTPRVTVYLGGTRLPVRQLPANGSVPNSRGPIVHVLAPGKRAFVVFLWTNWCGPPKIPSQATLRYSFGGGLVFSENWGAPTCTAARAPSTIRVGGPFRPLP